jgi:hypothetical protein
MMDRRFCERVERAFKNGGEHRESADEWCERVTTALEVGRMLALTDSALARLARGASRIRRRARSRWLEDIGQAGSVGS